MRHVNSTAKEVDVVVIAALRLVQLVSTSEHDLGIREQKSFATPKVRVRKFELSELVHAVIDYGNLVESSEHRRRGNRAVKPLNRIGEPRVQLTFLSDCILH